MKKFILTILLVATPIIVQSQIELKYIETAMDYTNNIVSEEIVIPNRIKFVSDKFLKIPYLLNFETKKKSKKGRFPWAIRYEENTYFNLRYSKEFSAFELYGIPDIVGKYCVFFSNKETLRTIHSYRIANSGGGLMGFLIDESRKWGNNWATSEGEKIKILIVKPSNLEFKRKGEYKNANWKVLTRSNFNSIMNTELSEQEIENLTLEEVKDIIVEINNAG